MPADLIDSLPPPLLPPLSLSHTLPSHLCGSLGVYDVSKEKRVSLKTPLPLQVCDHVFHKVTTTDDPVIRKVRKSTPISAHHFSAK